MTTSPTQWIAFTGPKRIALGAPLEVARAVQTFVTGPPEASVLIFDAQSSRPVELDLRGSLATVLGRVPVEGEPAAEIESVRSPGRPKLGVTPREVTLLPRHWDWLGTQPGGASVALRKLVEQALRANRDLDRQREARESAYRFMLALAGDERGFEEATRALFANDLAGLRQQIETWPEDIRTHALTLAEATR